MSQNLIEELKEEHSDLIQYVDKLLDDINTNLGLYDELKAKLLAHLEHEGKELYEPMMEEAKHNEVFKLTLDIFKDEIDGLTSEFMDFYRKYNSYLIMNNKDARDELIGLLIRLKIRINSEETVLFPMYSALAGN